MSAFRALHRRPAAALTAPRRLLRFAVTTVAAMALAFSAVGTAEAAPLHGAVVHVSYPAMGKATVAPMASIAITRGQAWIVLSHSDQETLRAGSTAYIEFFLTTVVCAFVGPLACFDIGFAVTTIQNYLTEHGVCSKKRSLYLPLNPSTIVPPLPLQKAFCQ